MAPLFRARKLYFGPELGCSAVGKGRAKGLILLGCYLRQECERSRALEQEDGKDLLLGDHVYLKITRTRSSVWPSPTRKKNPENTLPFIHTLQTSTIHTEWVHEQGDYKF